MASSDDDFKFDSLTHCEISPVQRGSAWFPDLEMLRKSAPDGYMAYQWLVNQHLAHIQATGLGNRELSPKYVEALAKFASHYPVRSRRRDRQFNSLHMWDVTIRLGALDLHR